ncbi:hypothetical protein F5Y08DRAFT_299750 [Xylaria arbuscula]|nr:hypothetical protein F5Y08DRAFT_299750 [Xylaria arbuscula]
MYSTKTLLFAAAFAGSSLSQSDSPACSSALSVFSGLIPEAPVTPTDILSFIAEHTEIPSFTIGDAESHQSQLCAVAAALPSSLLPELQTLGSELMDFARGHTSELVAYITACAPNESVASSSTSYFNHVLTYSGNICTESATATPGGASNGTYPTATPTATSGGFTTSLIPTAAAARPTGAFLRAAAAGGVVGAAAML